MAGLAGEVPNSDNVIRTSVKKQLESRNDFFYSEKPSSGYGITTSVQELRDKGTDK